MEVGSRVQHKCESAGLMGRSPKMQHEFAMVWVSPKLKTPLLTTARMLPLLVEVLASVLGDHLGLTMTGESTIDSAAGTNHSASERRREGGDGECSGRRCGERGQGARGESRCNEEEWLKKLWRREKDLRLDGPALAVKLGDVGLPGLAGWLLEYPVIYCCSSAKVDATVAPTSMCDRGEGASEAGNCLSMVPLRVCSVRLEAPGPYTSGP
ncbi:unnamed protein product, partial [Discosporangium mesarthrocarpum]